MEVTEKKGWPVSQLVLSIVKITLNFRRTVLEIQRWEVERQQSTLANLMSLLNT